MSFLRGAAPIQKSSVKRSLGERNRRASDNRGKQEKDEKEAGPKMQIRSRQITAGVRRSASTCAWSSFKRKLLRISMLFLCVHRKVKFLLENCYRALWTRGEGSNYRSFNKNGYRFRIKTPPRGYRLRVGDRYADSRLIYYLLRVLNVPLISKQIHADSAGG